ncbi:unnamed protein product [Chironomus riparius]|uniref:Uncharacterized protein n=1 Tax=Chironomus riparius TaxID=315576 RepID=A0A9N9RLW5_9DIPT|nr:unnamed protein product [Chironomus riparius]
MKFLLVSFFCCIIFGKSFSKNFDDVDDFKVLKGDYGVHADEDVRAFVHPAPKSITFEKRSAFNALRNNPPFPILSNDEIEDVEFNKDFDDQELSSLGAEGSALTNENIEKRDIKNPKKDKREALGDKSLIHTLSIQKNNKMNEKIKDTPDNSKFHGAQFLDE